MLLFVYYSTSCLGYTCWVLYTVIAVPTLCSVSLESVP